MKMKYKVSAIVPAYNEEKKITGVLRVLAASEYIHEVICVNDNSSDATKQIAESISGVKVVNLDTNYGKAYAVAKGTMEAKGDIIVFIDSDLTGLTSKSIALLIEPLLDAHYDAAIGYRSGKMDKLIFMPLSGERAYFKRDLLPHINSIKDKGYGLELYLNNAFKDKKVKLLALKGVQHTMKHKKHSYTNAAKGTMIEFVEVFSEIFKQKNPLAFFMNAYLYNFYLKTPKKKIAKNRLQFLHFFEY